MRAFALVLLVACDKREPPPPAKPAVDALAAKIAAHDTDKMFELTKIETLWGSDCHHQSVYERENLTDFLVIAAQTVKSPLTAATETAPVHEVSAGDTKLVGCPLQTSTYATTWRLEFGDRHLDVTFAVDRGQWRVLGAVNPLK